MSATHVRNDLFNARDGFDRGRPVWVLIFWQVVKWAFFRTTLPWPSVLKVQLLRFFGAKVGRGVYIKPQVNVHFPWKLHVGDHVWLGEEVFILNFEPVRIEAHACISQRAFLCTGNHDFRTPSMRYRNRAITIEAGAWIGAQVFVAPGVRVGVDAVITAGSILLKDAESGYIYSGNPASRLGLRWGDNR